MKTVQYKCCNCGKPIPCYAKIMFPSESKKNVKILPEGCLLNIHKPNWEEMEELENTFNKIPIYHELELRLNVLGCQVRDKLTSFSGVVTEVIITRFSGIFIKAIAKDKSSMILPANRIEKE